MNRWSLEFMNIPIDRVLLICKRLVNRGWSSNEISPGRKRISFNANNLIGGQPTTTMTKTGSERRAFRFSSNRSASDRERIYLESFNVSVENRNWSKVGQTFLVAKEKDERPLVEEFSTVCRPKLEEDEAKGRKSCKYFDDSVPRLPWNTAISSATAGFPQLFIEIVADADANADSDTDTGFVEPQLCYLFTSLRVFASCRFFLLTSPRLFVRILSTNGHVRCSNLSLDTCYQLYNYAKVRAYFVRISRQDSYATRDTRLDLQRGELDCPNPHR